MNRLTCHVKIEPYSKKYAMYCQSTLTVIATSNNKTIDIKRWYIGAPSDDVDEFWNAIPDIKTVIDNKSYTPQVAMQELYYWLLKLNKTYKVEIITNNEYERIWFLVMMKKAFNY